MEDGKYSPLVASGRVVHNSATQSTTANSVVHKDQRNFDDVLALIDSSLSYFDDSNENEPSSPAPDGMISELSGELLKLQNKCKVLEQQNAMLLSSRPLQAKGPTSGTHFRRASHGSSIISTLDVAAQIGKKNGEATDGNGQRSEKLRSLLSQISHQIDESTNQLDKRIELLDSLNDSSVTSQSPQAVALVHPKYVKDIVQTCVRETKRVLMQRNEMRQDQLDSQDAQVLERRELMNTRVENNRLKEQLEKQHFALLAAREEVEKCRKEVEQVEQLRTASDKEIAIATEESLLMQEKLREYSQENIRLRVGLSDSQRSQRELTTQLTELKANRDELIRKYNTLRMYSEQLSMMRG